MAAPPQARLRVIQFVCSIVCILAIGIICVPGPHGGPLFLGPLLLDWLDQGSATLVPLLLIAVPSLILICSALIERRMIRITMTVVGMIWLLLLFLLFLAGRILLVSAGPSLILLGICAFISTRPRRPAGSPPPFISKLAARVLATVLPRPGASARLRWFRIAFWLLVFILICAAVWWGLTGESILLVPPILMIGLLAAPVLIVFMIGIWLVGKRSDG
jgi:hypothetical protein